MGETNPYRLEPRYALYPDPENSAGGRLCFLIMQLTLKEYIRRFDRVNLCIGEWSMPDAKSKAWDLLYQREHPAVYILLGQKVTNAFGLTFEAFTVRRHCDYLESRFVVIPHPSGINRMWNEEGSIERARDLLRAEGLI